MANEQVVTAEDGEQWNDVLDVSRNALWHKPEAVALDKNRPLPQARKELEELKADLDVHGYCLIKDALSPEEVSAVRKRLEDQWAAEAEIGKAMTNPTGVHNTCNLLNKGDIFQKVVLHPVADLLLEHVLGDGFLISAICGPQTVPGSKAQGLHIDQFLFGVQTDFSLVANAFFMLDDFTEENGATRVIPGSHLWTPERIAERYEGLAVSGHGDGDNPPDTIPALGKAGTCFVFEGRLLHGAGKNQSTDKTRAGITSYYCRPWMRPFENAFLSIPDDTMASFPSALRAQLGYGTWGLAGGYQAPGMPASLDDIRPSDQVGELPWPPLKAE